MAKGEIVIIEDLCKGCGLCILHCKRGCLEFSEEKLCSFGTPLISFKNPDKCTACSICAWMCPEFAIEVYKYIEEAA